MASDSLSETRSECYDRMSRTTGSKILARLYRAEAAKWKAAEDWGQKARKRALPGS